MSTLDKLKSTSSRGDLAQLLGYKPKTLSYILYVIKDEDKYTEFSIPKKTGGARQIKAPIDQLKELQKHLSDLLSHCYDEINGEVSVNKSLSHGFRNKHSIITNAQKHKNKRHVFNIDLEDFFPSIHFGRIQGFFIKNKHFQLVPEVATTIAQIACHEKKLPQGSPCSPIISNLIGHLLDIRMVNLAKRAKCTYSRYADDLTFSTNKKEISPKIAVKAEETENEWIPSKTLIKEIEKVGFKINNKKVSMQHKTSRQTTTGLVVNKKVNIKKEYYRKARSMCHSLFKTGTFYTDNNSSVESVDFDDLPATTLTSENGELITSEGDSDELVSGTLDQLEGILSFIYHVKKEHDNRKVTKKRFEPTAISKLYRHFLFFRHFFKLDLPLIICEGKTDIIYLECALRQLTDKYREFVEKKEENFDFKIQFLNLSENFKDVFSISEGTPGLASLLLFYQEYMKPLKGDGKKQPVIMLVDNDEGAKEIKKKLTDDFTKPFIFYANNLYILPVHPKKGKAIEDLFEKSVLKTRVEGKSFNRNDKIDPQKEYGKIVYAKKVVEANQEIINFSGFEQIFDRLYKVLEDYSNKIMPTEDAHVE